MALEGYARSPSARWLTSGDGDDLQAARMAIQAGRIAFYKCLPFSGPIKASLRFMDMQKPSQASIKKWRQSGGAPAMVALVLSHVCSAVAAQQALPDAMALHIRQYQKQFIPQLRPHREPIVPLKRELCSAAAKKTGGMQTVDSSAVPRHG